jgi:hypothetical protein
MVVPINDWGLQYPAIPFMYLTNNIYQIIAYMDETVVTAGNHLIATLHSGEYARVSEPIGIITANKPVLVVQVGQVNI